MSEFVAGREAAAAQYPSMFRTAVEAAAAVLPDAPTATVEQVALAVLRVALPLHETQHADAWKATHERAVHFELELTKCAELNRGLVRENADLSVDLVQLREQLAEATTLLGHFVDHEDQPCSLDHHGACKEHGGSSLRRCDVAVGRELLARIRGVDGELGCLCPHTYQPDGTLVRDGVLAVGCPVHDPDAGKSGDV